MVLDTPFFHKFSTCLLNPFWLLVQSIPQQQIPQFVPQNGLPFAFNSCLITSLGASWFLSYKVHPYSWWFCLPPSSCPLIIWFQIWRRLSYLICLFEEAILGLWQVLCTFFFFLYHILFKMGRPKLCTVFNEWVYCGVLREHSDGFVSGFLLLAFFLTYYLFFNNYWALSWHLQKTISSDPKVSSLSGSSKLGACQYVCIVRVVFPKYITLHLSTWNFICHFITQPLGIVRLFCFPSQTAFVLIILNNFCIINTHCLLCSPFVSRLGPHKVPLVKSEHQQFQGRWVPRLTHQHTRRVFLLPPDRSVIKEVFSERLFHKHFGKPNMLFFSRLLLPSSGTSPRGLRGIH